LSYIVADVVDPNRDGYVSLQEYMAFMISKETENVQSSEEIENAFRAITAGDRPYVTKEELYAVSKFCSCVTYFHKQKLKIVIHNHP
jgi:Ca2+-binding EF-hand superfamily protein